jgi:hypothetical protein
MAFEEKLAAIPSLAGCAKRPLASSRALNCRPGPDERIDLRSRQSAFLEHFTRMLSE